MQLELFTLPHSLFLSTSSSSLCTSLSLTLPLDPSLRTDVVKTIIQFRKLSYTSDICAFDCHKYHR